MSKTSKSVTVKTKEVGMRELRSVSTNLQWRLDTSLENCVIATPRWVNYSRLAPSNLYKWNLINFPKIRLQRLERRNLMLGVIFDCAKSFWKKFHCHRDANYKTEKSLSTRTDPDFRIVLGINQQAPVFTADYLPSILWSIVAYQRECMSVTLASHRN